MMIVAHTRTPSPTAHCRWPTTNRPSRLRVRARDAASNGRVNSLPMVVARATPWKRSAASIKRVSITCRKCSAANKKSTEITFQKNANIDPIKLIELIQSDHRFKMNGPDKIKILLEEENITKRVMFITKKIKELKV